MLILIRNDGNHIEPLQQTQEVLLKILDRTGRHISVVAINEDSNTSEVTIAVEPPLVEHARVVLRDGEEIVELTAADIVARKAAQAAQVGGPEDASAADPRGSA